LACWSEHYENSQIFFQKKFVEILAKIKRVLTFAARFEREDGRDDRVDGEERKIFFFESVVRIK
jgi:hypothetical protein